MAENQFQGWNSLPYDIVVLMTQYLNQSDKMAWLHVCRDWNFAIQEKSVWISSHFPLLDAIQHENDELEENLIINFGPWIENITVNDIYQGGYSSERNAKLRLLFNTTQLKSFTVDGDIGDLDDVEELLKRQTSLTSFAITNSNCSLPKVMLMLKMVISNHHTIRKIKIDNIGREEDLLATENWILQFGAIWSQLIQVKEVHICFSAIKCEKVLAGLFHRTTSATDENTLEFLHMKCSIEKDFKPNFDVLPKWETGQDGNVKSFFPKTRWHIKIFAECEDIEEVSVFIPSKCNIHSLDIHCAAKSTQHVTHLMEYLLDCEINFTLENFNLYGLLSERDVQAYENFLKSCPNLKKRH